MNWKRIVVFSLAAILATAFAALPFGFIRGFVAARGERPPAILDAGQAVVVALVAVLVFGLLTFLQRERALAHVAVTAAVVWGMSTIINALVLGEFATRGVAVQALVGFAFGASGWALGRSARWVAGLLRSAEPLDLDAG